jgi:hypothetical protein
MMTEPDESERARDSEVPSFEYLRARREFLESIDSLPIEEGSIVGGSDQSTLVCGPLIMYATQADGAMRPIAELVPDVIADGAVIHEEDGTQVVAPLATYRAEPIGRRLP